MIQIRSEVARQRFFYNKRPAFFPGVFFLIFFFCFFVHAAEAESLIREGEVPEKLCEGLQWGEGPVYHPDGYLLFSDMPQNTIMKYSPGKLSVYLRGMAKPNGLALDAQGRLYVCQHGERRIIRIEKDGGVTVLADKFNGKRLNNPNDLVIRSDGSIYFTDHSFSNHARSQVKELAFNGVYFCSPNGELRWVSNDFARPNGLALSPDEKHLYVNDTEHCYIRAFDVASDGTLSGGSIFAEMSGKDGVADGMETDAEGRVFSTGPGGVWIFDTTGALIQKIDFPEQTTNLAWGDDGKSLYVTCGHGLYRVKMKTGERIR